MKKKLIFMALLTVLLTLTFIGCDPFEKQKTIVVTGIPSTTGYNYGYVGLGNSDNKVVAISYPVQISGGKITCELIDAKDLDAENPFTDKGTYTVILSIISNGNNVDSDVWSGFVRNKNIEDEVTTIPFSNFVEITSSIQLKELFKR